VTLRNRGVFRVAGYTLVGIALVAFASRVAWMALNGYSLNTFHSGRMIQWTFGAAFIALAALVFAGIVAGVVRVASWLKWRYEFTKFERAHRRINHSSMPRDASSPNKSLERTRER
jgi:hypothetical protein